MSQLTLYIGNKNYSSWSFRAWLALKSIDLPFNEILIPLRRSDTKSNILKVSSSGFVPCLHHESIKIHDSLAISEYVSELCPKKNLFPADKHARAMARSICAEMHSSFSNLRNEMPMDMNHREQKIPSDATQNDINRILSIWKGIKEEFGESGDFLFGSWSIADIFFAPVVSRFISYGVNTQGFQNYIETVCQNDLYQEWYNAAKTEITV